MTLIQAQHLKDLARKAAEASAKLMLELVTDSALAATIKANHLAHDAFKAAVDALTDQPKPLTGLGFCE